MDTPHTKSFSEKFKENLSLIIKSFKFIMTHKKLMLFPILKLILIIPALIAIYATIIYFGAQKQHAANTSTLFSNLIVIISCLATIFVSTFFSVFTDVALSSAATQALNGSISIKKSFSQSFSRIGTISTWALSATIIKFLLQGKKNNSSRNFMSDLAGSIIGLAWYIATFLVIPVITYERLSAIDSIKRSADLMRKNFGQNVSSSLILPLFSLLVIVIFGLLGFGIVYLLKSTDPNGQAWIVATTILLTLGFLIIMALHIVISATTIIFKTAVYQYTIGAPVKLFNQSEIQSTFTK